MSELITIQSTTPIALPAPRVAISVRAATMDDLAFIDALQKKTSRQVGFMPTKQLEGKIALGHVIVAMSASGERAGYLIGNDQYFKRDDVGIIYAINVVPEYRRSLVAATLLKAQFERSAYGCRLYCCWCAQDIEANRFWESLGFVPLAFRAGSEKKARVHIFWQKRIRAGDTATPWWFPSKTTGGSIREDRIVLPIPPGTHWSDAKPLILPAVEQEKPRALPAVTRERKTRPTEAKAPAARNGLSFDIPQPGEALVETKSTKVEKPAKEKSPRVKRKADPRMTAAARELRDRWLEHVNDDAIAIGYGKYEVTRAITNEKAPPSMIDAVPVLPLLAA